MGRWKLTLDSTYLSLLPFGEVAVRNKLEMTFFLLCVVDDLHVSRLGGGGGREENMRKGKVGRIEGRREEKGRREWEGG